MNDNYCLNCGDEITQSEIGRARMFCEGSTCRVSYHRKKKRYIKLKKSVTESPDLSGVLVLELFPGAGLFGRAFKALGACVVNPGDIMHGYDIRDFIPIDGKFDGIIGGPPCQFASRAAVSGTDADNLIPEFVRVVKQANPKWAVMENVREARSFAPDWDYVYLRDYDCGGYTHRRRGFWFYGTPAPIPPNTRPGIPEYSPLASSWNKRGKNSIMGLTHNFLSPDEASRLQGFPLLDEIIIDNQPGWLRSDGSWNGIGIRGRKIIATHLIGNGVPLALGKYVAEWIAVSVYGATQSTHPMQLQLQVQS